MEEKEKIVNMYCVPIGVAREQIKPMLEELGLNETRFYKFMEGQTCGVVGNTPVYYKGDIMKFIRNNIQ